MVCIFPGAQNFSLILNDDYGRAEIASNITYINGKNIVYNFQTYAGMISINVGVGYGTV